MKFPGLAVPPRYRIGLTLQAILHIVIFMQSQGTTGFGERLKRLRTERKMTQTELGQFLGVSQETIASYERSGRFPRPRALREIARFFGVSLDELLRTPELAAEASVEAPSEAEPGAAGFDVEGLIAALRFEPMDRAFAFCSSWKAARSLGLADLFQEALIPLLARIGLLWQGGELSVADEHFLSERVRELAVWLAKGEQDSGHLVTGTSRRWIGLCAPAEKHDLALYLHSLVLRQAGWQTWYLGTQVPLNDLLDAIARYQPQVLGFSVTLQENMEGLEQYARRIRERFGPRPAIIVGGQGALRPGPGLTEIVDAFTSSIIEGFALTEKLSGAD
jgi:MerR family transcriptional regulator, light-induced transcriptional regulator